MALVVAPSPPVLTHPPGSGAVLASAVFPFTAEFARCAAVSPPLQLGDLSVVFCEPLEHVGIDLLVLLVVFPHLPLAEGDLRVGGTVGGVHLEHVPEIF